MTGQRKTGCSSKLYLAWLSDPLTRPASLSAERKDAGRTLVPWTRVLPLLAPDDLDRLRRERGEYHMHFVPHFVLDGDGAGGTPP